MDAFEDTLLGAPQSKTPDIGSVGGQYQQMVGEYLGAQPQIFDAQQTYQPQYEGLDLTGMETGVNAAAPLIGSTYAGLAPVVAGGVNAANTSTRTATTGDIASMGPGTVNAIKAANPGQAGLMDNLTATANEQLSLGTQLDPNTVKQIDQTVGGNWANRGLGTSNPAQLNEAMDYFGAGQNLLTQREQTAGSVANQDANLYTDPAFQVLTGTSAAPGTAASLTGTATNTGTGVAGTAAAPLVSPEEADSMLGTIYNATGSTNIANTNTKAGLASGEISAMGSIGSSM